MEKDKGIEIYKSKDGKIELEVKLVKDTAWLTQKQIAELFGVNRPAITKHLINIFSSMELKEKEVCSILEHTAADGKTYKTNYYNLDAIICIGYRVNSKKATQFRIWATDVLKRYLVDGYAINEKRLKAQENKIKELQSTVAKLFMRSMSEKD